MEDENYLDPTSWQPDAEQRMVWCKHNRLSKCGSRPPDPSHINTKAGLDCDLRQHIRTNGLILTPRNPLNLTISPYCEDQWLVCGNGGGVNDEVGRCNILCLHPWRGLWGYREINGSLLDRGDGILEKSAQHGLCEQLCKVHRRQIWLQIAW